MTKFDAVIQARLGSRRLPNKVLTPVSGRVLLGRVIDRIKLVKGIDRIVVVTTLEKSDDIIVEFCKKEGVLCFRGDTNDVLDRYISACKEFDIKRIVRVCSDNPFIDIEQLDLLIEEFEDTTEYSSFYTNHDEPIILKPSGLFAELCEFSALCKSADYAARKKDFRINEHVTYHMHTNPLVYEIKKKILPKYVDPEVRFTIDYYEDIKVCEHIVNSVENINCLSLHKYLERNPEVKQQILRFSKENPKQYPKYVS